MPILRTKHPANLRSIVAPPRSAKERRRTDALSINSLMRGVDAGSLDAGSLGARRLTRVTNDTSPSDAE